MGDRWEVLRRRQPGTDAAGRGTLRSEFLPKRPGATVNRWACGHDPLGVTALSAVAVSPATVAGHRHDRRGCHRGGGANDRGGRQPAGLETFGEYRRRLRRITATVHREPRQRFGDRAVPILMSPPLMSRIVPRRHRLTKRRRGLIGHGQTSGSIGDRPRGACRGSLGASHRVTAAARLTGRVQAALTA